MLKRILISLLFASPTLLFAQGTEETPQVRFGYLGYSAVFKAMPEYAQAQEELNLLRSKYEAEIKRADEEFNRKYGEFLQEQKEFPEAILLRRQKELQQLMEKSISFRDEVKQLLEEARQKMTEPVRAKLDEVLAVIAESHDFAFILNTDGNACPYIDPLCGTDVTEEAKALLGMQDDSAQ